MLKETSGSFRETLYARREYANAFLLINVFQKNNIHSVKNNILCCIFLLHLLHNVILHMYFKNWFHPHLSYIYFVIVYLYFPPWHKLICAIN